jgi:hypothetical protein
VTIQTIAAPDAATSTPGTGELSLVDERLTRLIEVDETTGCWRWQGNVFISNNSTANTYARIHLDGLEEYVHISIWHTLRGERSRQLRRACDPTSSHPCVRPAPGHWESPTGNIAEVTYLRRLQRTIGKRLEQLAAS